MLWARTVSQEDLTLSVGGPCLGIWISISEFIAGFDVDMSTLGDGPEECVRGGIEREDSVP
jgi:hypothetical protein